MIGQKISEKLTLKSYLLSTPSINQLMGIEYIFRVNPQSPISWLKYGVITYSYPNFRITPEREFDLF